MYPDKWDTNPDSLYMYPDNWDAYPNQWDTNTSKWDTFAADPLFSRNGFRKALESGDLQDGGGLDAAFFHAKQDVVCRFQGKSLGDCLDVEFPREA